MKIRANLTKTFLCIVSVFLIDCGSFLKKDVLAKDENKVLRICFWNLKNLSLKGLKRENKGSYILRFSKSCDIISYLEIRSADIDMASAFSDALAKAGSEFICEEGMSKGMEEGTRTEKYLSCAKKEISDEIQKIEYPDDDNEFARPPTFFFVNTIKKKILLVPFHSTPGDKEELTHFQKVVDLAYKNYSDRRIFFGGDFNTGTNYQKQDFLNTIPYFTFLSQLIKEPTTFGNQNHDLIFTDKISAAKCTGKVWRLDELFPEVEGRKNLEKISDHFPVSADCKFK